ncbi:MAG: hypothetical protein K2Y27_23100 [Xanthobacteraceae bacterium]|nr:hypothetical protein [Xanthobacteraceae bacterium]
MSTPDDPILTLRVALDSPSDAVSTMAAQRFGSAGFKVESVTPRGLLIEGRRSLIEQFFDTRIDLIDKIMQFSREPKFSRLPESASYRAYFPRTPTYF